MSRVCKRSKYTKCSWEFGGGGEVTQDLLSLSFHTRTAIAEGRNGVGSLDGGFVAVDGDSTGGEGVPRAGKDGKEHGREQKRSQG